MRAFLFILALSTCAIGCKKKDSAMEALADQTATQPVTDSVRIVGELILKGEQIFGKNEKYIFALIDSLTQNNKTSRQFYFKVLAKIIDQSDGHLAESIGAELLKYIESDPFEFIQNSKYVSDSTFKTMAYYSVDEISLSADDHAKAEQEFERLKGEWTKRMEKASAEDNARLNDFFQYMKSALNAK